MKLKAIRTISLLFLLLCIPTLAAPGEMTVVGYSQDEFGNKIAVTLVELGRDRYLAVGIEGADKAQGATAIILKNEVPRLLKMCEKGADLKNSMKTGQFQIVDSFEGDQSLAVIRANPEGDATVTVIQITEDGRERHFLLNRKTWPALRENIKKAQKKL
jgi:hypothetical protein